MSCLRLATSGPASARELPDTRLTHSVESRGVMSGTPSIRRSRCMTRAVRSIISR